MPGGFLHFTFDALNNSSASILFCVSIKIDQRVAR